MPFVIYDVTSQGPCNQYAYCGSLRLAGYKGPLASIAKAKNMRRTVPFAWHATGKEIIETVSGVSAKKELIIDLKPNQKTNVSLYRLVNIWGYSYKEWTPVALHLETLFVDREEKNADEFKKCFSDEEFERDYLDEFLYLQGGVIEGTWNWGMVGRVNGALLWPDAFQHLAGSLLKVLK